MQASLDYLRTKVYAESEGKQSALCGIRKDRIFAIFQYLCFGESIIHPFSAGAMTMASMPNCWRMTYSHFLDVKAQRLPQQQYSSCTLILQSNC